MSVSFILVEVINLSIVHSSQININFKTSLFSLTLVCIFILHRNQVDSYHATVYFRKLQLDTPTTFLILHNVHITRKNWSLRYKVCQKMLKYCAYWLSWDCQVLDIEYMIWDAIWNDMRAILNGNRGDIVDYRHLWFNFCVISIQH